MLDGLLTVDKADDMDEGVVVVVRRLLEVTETTEDGDVPFRRPLPEAETPPSVPPTVPEICVRDVAPLTDETRPGRVDVSALIVKP